MPIPASLGDARQALGLAGGPTLWDRRGCRHHYRELYGSPPSGKELEAAKFGFARYDVTGPLAQFQSTTLDAAVLMDRSPDPPAPAATVGSSDGVPSRS